MKVVFSVVFGLLFTMVQGQDCKIVSGVKGKAGFEHVVNYTESGNVSSIVYNGNDTTTFGVVSNGKLIGHYSKDSGVKDYETEILRDSLDRVYQVNNYMIEDGVREIYFRFTFEYNKKGQVSRIEKIRGDDTMNRNDGFASEFKYKKGNIVAEKLFMFGDEIGTVKMKYSKVQNPMKGSDLYYFFLTDWDYDERYFVSWLSKNVMEKEVMKKLDVFNKEMKTYVTSYAVEENDNSIKITETYNTTTKVCNYTVKCD